MTSETLTKPAFLEGLIVEHGLHSARWKEHTAHETENTCHTRILENKSFRRASSTVPRYVLVILPMQAELNFVKLTEAVQELFLSRQERGSPIAWEVADDEDVKRYLGGSAGGIVDASSLTSVDPCPLWASPDPCRAPRIPVFLCQSAVQPFLWMPTGADTETTLGLSLRDVMHAIKPCIVRGLSKSSAVHSRNLRGRALVASPATTTTCVIATTPRDEESPPSATPISSNSMSSADDNNNNNTTVTEKTVSLLSLKEQRNEGMATTPRDEESPPSATPLSSNSMSSADDNNNNNTTVTEKTVSSLSLKEQRNEGIASKIMLFTKLSMKTGKPGRVPDTEPVPAPSYRSRGLTRRENPVLLVRNRHLNSDSPPIQRSERAQEEIPEECNTSNETGGPESSHGDDYTSEDDANIMDTLLSDDDDLAMLNELTRETPDIDEDETVDFEEAATTGELGLEEELLEDSRHATVTERVSNYRVERIRHFERQTPSRTMSVEEHPESDPEEIAEAQAPPEESRREPGPRRRRRRRKLRKGDENFERHTPSRSVSVSEHPEFDPECLEEAQITEATPPAGGQDNNFTRRTPSRAVSTSEHPSFDVEACITEASVPSVARSQFSRKTPSRAVSTSEHPGFDSEDVITEAVPPRSSNFSRKTPSRAISTSEHPDFDLEVHVSEAVPPGLLDVARQVEMDLEQDRKEQALAEATFASESSMGADIVEDGMPSATDDISEGSNASPYDDEDTDSSEEEETLHADEPTETQNGTDAEVTETQDTETSTVD